MPSGQFGIHGGALVAKMPAQFSRILALLFSPMHSSTKSRNRQVSFIRGIFILLLAPYIAFRCTPKEIPVFFVQFSVNFCPFFPCPVPENVAFSPALAAELPAPAGARFPIVDEAAVAAEASGGGTMGGQQQQPRRNFPETWIWTPDDFGTRRVPLLFCILNWKFGKEIWEG